MNIPAYDPNRMIKCRDGSEMPSWLVWQDATLYGAHCIDPFVAEQLGITLENCPPDPMVGGIERMARGFSYDGKPVLRLAVDNGKQT